MKQTPEIVIEPKQISACVDCPFFYEPTQGIYDYGLAPELYCHHPSFKFGRWMNETNRFDTILGTEIWIHCPQPDVEQGDSK